MGRNTNIYSIIKKRCGADTWHYEDFYLILIIHV